MNLANPQPDRTDRQRFAGAGVAYHHRCGIGPGEHQALQTTGGRVHKATRIWYCAQCVALRGIR